MKRDVWNKKWRNLTMNSYERIMQMINDLQAESDKLSGSLDVEKAKHMLILSECITAGLQSFLFKNI